MLFGSPNDFPIRNLFRQNLTKPCFLCSQVHAKHEEKSDSKSVYREYNREFLLPKGTNPESIKSSLSKDGVLTVEAPLPALGAPEKLIPIAH
ncbi:alpha-crystallin B chain-like [Diaphorina citri]|uniref:Alpha-crystallin B chain-like n=1 Tax=Diaphorina citri TaxID=121845 RepID=A0A3Q0JC25_DIACI|nr:alpha-crystallin B chain-like [Diaphorina citri]